MTTEQQQLIDIKSDIRVLEKKIDNKKWGAGIWFTHIILILLTGGIWLILMALAWLLSLVFPDNKDDKKLEQLYKLQDELELQIKEMK